MSNPAPIGDHAPSHMPNHTPGAYPGGEPLSHQHNSHFNEQPPQWGGETNPTYGVPPTAQPYPPQYQPYPPQYQPYQPAGAPPYPGYPEQYVPGMNPTNPLAIASFVCSLVGVFVSGLGIVGIILGHIALGQIKRSNGYEQGRGFALAGLIIGYIWLGLIVIAIVAFVLLFLLIIPATTPSTP